MNKFDFTEGEMINFIIKLKSLIKNHMSMDEVFNLINNMDFESPELIGKATGKKWEELKKCVQKKK